MQIHTHSYVQECSIIRVMYINSGPNVMYLRTCECSEAPLLKDSLISGHLSKEDSAPVVDTQTLQTLLTKDSADDPHQLRYSENTLGN